MHLLAVFRFLRFCLRCKAESRATYNSSTLVIMTAARIASVCAKNIVNMLNATQRNAMHRRNATQVSAHIVCTGLNSVYVALTNFFQFAHALLEGLEQHPGVKWLVVLLLEEAQARARVALGELLHILLKCEVFLEEREKRV